LSLAWYWAGPRFGGKPAFQDGREKRGRKRYQTGAQRGGGKEGGQRSVELFVLEVLRAG